MITEYGHASESIILKFKKGIYYHVKSKIATFIFF